MKRPAEATETMEVEGQASVKAQALSNGASPVRRKEAPVDPEMGEFEDNWEDEIDSEEEVVEEHEDYESGKSV